MESLSFLVGVILCDLKSEGIVSKEMSGLLYFKGGGDCFAVGVISIEFSVHVYLLYFIVGVGVSNFIELVGVLKPLLHLY